MDLHTVDKLPDWELVSVEDRNQWQQIAARTNGIVTPANAVTLAGNLLTFYGVLKLSQRHGLAGASLIALGRGLDVVDGHVAQITGTKSPLGEAFDAGFDKIQAAAAIPILAVSGSVPKTEATIIGIQQAAISGVSMLAKYRGNEIHPSRSGKLATFAAWTSLVSHAISTNVDNKTLARGFETLGTASTIAATVLGVSAIRDYSEAALQ